jgi:hypothetical protein
MTSNVFTPVHVALDASYIFYEFLCFEIEYMAPFIWYEYLVLWYVYLV